jgi:hypothetical protein
MKEFVVKNWLCLFVVLVGFSLTAVAQKVEVFGGYQFTHLDSSLNMNGWNGAVTGNFRHVLGITGDVSGSYKSGVHFYTYTAGPVLTARLPVVQPFAHLLLGGGRATGFGSSNNGFVLMAGGGLDVGLRKGIAFRVIQFDWIRTHFSGISDNKNARVSAGIVLKF